jgi:hypothetical protein
MAWKRWVLLLLALFVALGALGGGMGLILDPTGAAIGMDSTLLGGTPFSDFLVPGMLLLIAVGGVQLQAAGFAAVNDPMTGGIQAVAGVTLALWIGVQVVMIGLIHPFQVAMGLIAVAQVILGLSVARAPSSWGSTRHATG